MSSDDIFKTLKERYASGIDKTWLQAVANAMGDSISQGHTRDDPNWNERTLDKL